MTPPSEQEPQPVPGVCAQQRVPLRGGPLDGLFGFVVDGVVLVEAQNGQPVAVVQLLWS